MIRSTHGILQSMERGSKYIVATGGTSTRNGDWIIHTFTSNGTFTITEYPADSMVWVLAVGGGGGAAGWYYGGAGGAGGYRNVPGYIPSTGLGAYPVVIGAGGVGGANINNSTGHGTKGGDSTFDSISAAGGGCGIYYSGTGSGDENGGSGGSYYGGATYGNMPATYPPQGNPGGVGGYIPPHVYQGGGGGARSAGDPGSNSAMANGGAGAINYMTGSPITYSTGGNNGFLGGDGVSGTANTGDGGQGAGALGGLGGNGGSGIVRIAYYSPLSSPATIGSLHTFTYDSADYNFQGGAITATYTPGTSVRLQGTNFDNNDNYVYDKNYLSDCGNMVYQASFQFNSLGATDFGGSLRIYSLSAGNGSITLRVGAATGVNKGVVKIYKHNTELATLGTFPTLNLGDTIVYRIEIDNNTLNFSVTNGATTISGSYVFDYNYTATPIFVPPLYAFGLGSSGGDYLVTGISATTTDKRYCDLLVGMDSRPYGLFVTGTDPALRLAGVWGTANPGKRVYSQCGCGESLPNLISRMPEIINYAPRQFIIVGIYNDVYNGRTSSQIKSDYDTIIYVLENYGIACKIQISPTSGIDQSAANAAVAAAYPNHIISEPPTWDVMTDLCPDDAHWTPAGNNKMYANQALVVKLP